MNMFTTSRLFNFEIRFSLEYVRGIIITSRQDRTSKGYENSRALEVTFHEIGRYYSKASAYPLSMAESCNIKMSMLEVY